MALIYTHSFLVKVCTVKIPAQNVGTLACATLLIRGEISQSTCSTTGICIELAITLQNITYTGGKYYY